MDQPARSSVRGWAVGPLSLEQTPRRSSLYCCPASPHALLSVHILEMLNECLSKLYERWELVMIGSYTKQNVANTLEATQHNEIDHWTGTKYQLE